MFGLRYVGLFVRGNHNFSLSVKRSSSSYFGVHKNLRMHNVNKPSRFNDEAFEITIHIIKSLGEMLKSGVCGVKVVNFVKVYIFL